MFTGIIQTQATITALSEKQTASNRVGCLKILASAAFCEHLQLGASVAVDGVCLTVVALEGGVISFDLLAETMVLTTLGRLSSGARVNCERAAQVGDELGGHWVSGHVHGVADVIGQDQQAGNYRLLIQLPSPWIKYAMPKGSITLNGVSLTIAAVDTAKQQLSVYLIPETLARTNLAALSAGNKLNFEMDQQIISIVHTTEQVLTRFLTIGANAIDI